MVVRMALRYHEVSWGQTGNLDQHNLISMRLVEHNPHRFAQ